MNRGTKAGEQRGGARTTSSAEPLEQQRLEDARAIPVAATVLRQRVEAGGARADPRWWRPSRPRSPPSPPLGSRRTPTRDRAAGTRGRRRSARRRTRRRGHPSTGRRRSEHREARRPGACRARQLRLDSGDSMVSPLGRVTTGSSGAVPLRSPPYCCAMATLVSRLSLPGTENSRTRARRWRALPPRSRRS